jgi:hypothetical protein
LYISLPSTTFTMALGWFSLRILRERRANFECRHAAVHRSCWQLTKFITLFRSKFEMPIYMKVVSLNKMDNFHERRF